MISRWAIFSLTRTSILYNLFMKKVADFGQACFIGHTTFKPFSKYAGTLYYQAPEQLRQDPSWLSQKVDCWALGIVFFIILEGRHPFIEPGEEIDGEVLLQRISTKPPLFKKTVNLKYVQLVSGLLATVMIIYHRLLKRDLLLSMPLGS